jgi:hypothetical protein
MTQRKNYHSTEKNRHSRVSGHEDYDCTMYTLIDGGRGGMDGDDAEKISEESAEMEIFVCHV